ncbi:tRNA lysidine(34) synthetase TilS [Flammeovirga sp. EKP202]|uniref:tRNA lysidine(34) synthetase TilS n=1 Tax=Flammeovirga sp. EKP202 TaxID=2770592 RepID=UPI00165ECE4D|nr:tRNA lysidine(34) synthetase TilS [Flammeovirga sp. EKP202]MBD0402145.1 tRNA lysidine(34) synthetase TilS [Flammeovirga sp. EKP202]
MIDIRKTVNDQFLTFLNRIGVQTHKNKLLLAFSGGVDSVVLALLLKVNKVDFALAHMNFQLRGEDSEQDEQFARDFAKKMNVPIFVKKVDTAKKVEEDQQSIQMVARKLRYDWFQYILKENNYDFIATAHHKSDHLETILFNLTKGTGIEGLHGILPKRGNIIRPLLFLSKEEIIQIAQESKWEWREDQSNQSTKYARNKLRHLVIPILKEINPSVEKTIQLSSELFYKVEQNLFYQLEIFKKKYVKESEEEISITLRDIQSIDEILLFYYLKPYQFDYNTVKDLYQNKDKSSLVYYSTNKVMALYTTQNDTILKEVADHESDFSLATNITSEEKEFFHKHNKVVVVEKQIHSVDEMSLDDIYIPESLFPLTIRNVKKGDRIKPFGMRNGSKKVFDLLQDEKIPQYLRSEILVLESKDGEILSVLGIRNSESLRITNFPCKLMMISIEKH